jgi:opacity protein-like surface antigen
VALIGMGMLFISESERATAQPQTGAGSAPPPATYPAQPPYPPPSYPGYYTVVTPQPPLSLVHGFIDGGYNDAIDRTGSNLQGGYTVGTGLLVNVSPASPLDVRLDIHYSHNDATQSFLLDNVPSTASYARGGADIWDAALDLQIHLGSPNGFNPYVFGGGGAYNTAYNFRSVSYPAGNGCNPYYSFCDGIETRTSTSVTKFGWNAGAGIEVPLAPWGPKLFVEGRYTRILQGYGQPPLKFVPITVGIRF